MPKSITVDVETDGLDKFRDKLVTIAYRFDDQGPVEVIEFDKGERGSKEFILALGDPSIIKRGHNVTFDILFLENNGYSVNGPLDDTKVLAYLADPFADHGLKALVEHTLGKVPTKLKDIKKRKGRKLEKVSEIDRAALIAYNKEDVVNTGDIRKLQYPSKWYIEVEQPLINIVRDMEKRGIQLDIPKLRELDDELTEKIQQIEKEFTFNPKSPKQVSEHYEKEVDIRDYTRKTKSGQWQVNKLALKKLVWDGYEPATRLLKYRELSKLKTTYTVPLLSGTDNDGRIHGSFNQAGSSEDTGGTATGRLTSSGPNLQNIPDRTKEGKRIRECFIATIEPGVIWTLGDADLKQIEPRLVAHYSQSEKLLDAYNNGLDTHALMASSIFDKDVSSLSKIERFVGKTSWLATVYGSYPKKLKQICEIYADEKLEYPEDFYEEVRDNFWKANPEIERWRNQHIEATRRVGYITTLGGRRIVIPNINSKSFFDRNEAERLAVNYLIQGSASDIMKIGLVKLQQVVDYMDLGNSFKILATIHDEILYEFLIKPEEALELVGDAMTYSVKLDNVPLEVDNKIVNNWSEK